LTPGTWDPKAQERPYTTAVVRYQAQHGGTVTNGRHMPVKLQGVDAYFVRLMDGSRTVPQIVEHILQQEQAGELNINLNTPDPDADKRTLLETHGTELVRRLARLALLFPAPEHSA